MGQPRSELAHISSEGPSLCCVSLHPTAMYVVVAVNELEFECVCLCMDMWSAEMLYRPSVAVSGTFTLWPCVYIVLLGAISGLWC